MRKLLATIMIALFLASMFYVVKPSASSAPTGKVEGVDELDWECGTPYMKWKAYSGAQLPYGNPHWTVVVTDTYLAEDYLQDFELFGTGVYCKIWVGLNDTFGDYYNPTDDSYHFFYGGIIREDIIYGANLTYMINEFDNVIYPADTTYFAVPKERPPGDKTINILVYNMRDTAFWTPYPSYTAGMFSLSMDLVYDRNIINIDTYDWQHRIGPNPPPGPTTQRYLYEGVIAHEFQHLIHADIDPGEYEWVDEGCADIAGYFCGFGHSIASSHLAAYMRHFWWTPLTRWLGQLSNYGAAYLFMLYLYEHYGGASTISAIVHEKTHGIESVNKVLAALGYKKNFDEIFQDYTMANYLDDTSFANGIYGYNTLDIPSVDTRGRSIEQQLSLYWGIPPYTSYPVTTEEIYGLFYSILYGTFQPYTAHYLRFADGAPAIKVHLDGAEIMGLPPYDGMYDYYSGFGNWLWNRMHQRFDIPLAGAKLKFWTYWEIEEDWDYGYVEVHNLDTDEWTTLPGIHTTTGLPIRQDNLNVPPEFEPTYYKDADKWNAFTGFSSGWYQEEMDLSPFAGHAIEVYFTYWTDAAFNEMGWFIDDIEISELGFFDGAETGIDGWTIDAGWYGTTGLVQNRFTANIMQKVTLPNGQYTAIHPILLHKETQEGMTPIIMLQDEGIQFGTAVMVIADQPGIETMFTTTYIYDATTLPFGSMPRGTLDRIMP